MMGVLFVPRKLLSLALGLALGLIPQAALADHEEGLRHPALSVSPLWLTIGVVAAFLVMSLLTVLALRYIQRLGD